MEFNNKSWRLGRLLITGTVTSYTRRGESRGRLEEEMIHSFGVPLLLTKTNTWSWLVLLFQYYLNGLVLESGLVFSHVIHCSKPLLLLLLMLLV